MDAGTLARIRQVLRYSASWSSGTHFVTVAPYGIALAEAWRSVITKLEGFDQPLVVNATDLLRAVEQIPGSCEATVGEDGITLTDGLKSHLVSAVDEIPLAASPVDPYAAGGQVLICDRLTLEAALNQLEGERVFIHPSEEPQHLDLWEDRRPVYSTVPCVGSLQTFVSVGREFFLEALELIGTDDADLRVTDDYLEVRDGDMSVCLMSPHLSTLFDPQVAMLAETARRGHVLRLGTVARSISVTQHWASEGETRLTSEPQSGTLVLGPPRVGKTTGCVIPNILGWNGPLVSTSTKTDVLEATATARARLGRCWLFDPAGTVRLQDQFDLGFVKVERPDIESLHWSPVTGCKDWSTANRVARQMADTSRLVGRGERDDPHWSERAGALLGTLLHAAALDGKNVRHLTNWVWRRDPAEAQDILREAVESRDRDGSQIAASALHGLISTDARELSGIWSTADGILSAYRDEAALLMSDDPNFDPAEFPRSQDTVYIATASAPQEAVAPLIVGFLQAMRDATFSAALKGNEAPVLWALDEVANIAPIPDLPSLVSQAGSQGLIVLAAFQDLSQARKRWGDEGLGFLSLFHSKVVFPGIGDTETLERFSVLAGEQAVQVTSESKSETSGSYDSRSESTTTSSRKERILPVSQLAQGPFVIQMAGWLGAHVFAGTRIVASQVEPFYSNDGGREPWALIAGGPDFCRILNHAAEELRVKVMRAMSRVVWTVLRETGLESRLWSALIEVACQHGVTPTSYAHAGRIFNTKGGEDITAAVSDLRKAVKERVLVARPQFMKPDRSVTESAGMGPAAERLFVGERLWSALCQRWPSMSDESVALQQLRRKAGQSDWVFDQPFALNAAFRELRAHHALSDEAWFWARRGATLGLLRGDRDCFKDPQLHHKPASRASY